jgi:D-alanyl-D-alanine carboxypeptidase (penicillin-binding protein 5/6)
MVRMRPVVRFGALLAVFLLVAGLVSAGPASSAELPHGLSWIVTDATTGDVLAERDADRPRPPASLAKIVTALVVIEQASLEDTVTISPAAAHAEADRLAWPLGRTYTVEQILYGMLMESSNGAAIALADHVAGSSAAFAELMTVTAAAVGATHSHFVTPNGLDAPGQAASARDLAAAARALLQNETLARIVRTSRYTVPWLGGPATFHNSNRFLASYPGSVGVKPGYTRAAGNCLAAAATRGDKTLIAVVLNSPSVTEDASTLIDEGFARLHVDAEPIILPEDEPSPSETDAEPAPVPVYSDVLAQDEVAPVRIRDSRAPSPAGTVIVLAVSGFIVRRRRTLPP